MAGNKEFNTDIDVKGKVAISDLPNNTGKPVIWNPTTGNLSTREKAEFVSDFQLATEADIQAIEQDLANKSDNGHSHSWGSITGKPTSFTPSTHTHDDRYYTKNEINTQLEGKADVEKSSKKTLASTGWFRIAQNSGNRAFGRFVVKEEDSGSHQTIEFIAGIHYGRTPIINLLANSSYGSGGSFRYVRLVHSSTYDPVYLEVYVDRAEVTGSQVFLYRNIQEQGWSVVDWTPGSVPSGYDTTEIDLDKTTGFLTTDEIFALKDKKVWHEGNFNPSSKSDVGHTHAWTAISGKPTVFPPETHNHDDRYYTSGEIDTKLAGKANSSHSHSWTSITGKPTTFPPSVHNHPEYLTEETDPTVPSHVKSITSTEKSNWNTAYSWGDFRQFGLEAAVDITNQDMNNVTKTGFYYGETYNGADGGGATIKSEPWFYMVIGSSSHTFQVAYERRVSLGDGRAGRRYRQQVNGVWGSWIDMVVDSTDVQNAISGHTHSWSQITGKPSTFTPATHSHGWTEITGKPSSFTPSSHSHSWTEITGKPSTYTPSTHTHDDRYYTETEVDNLLAGKANSSHSHSWSSITSKPTTFTPSAHSHSWTEITSKPSTFTPSAHDHSRLLTGAVSDLNAAATSTESLLTYHRYSSSAANKPMSSNNANGVLTMQSHSGTYGKQIAFGDSDDLYIRKISSGSFGSWRKLWHAGNFNPANYLTSESDPKGVASIDFSGSGTKTLTITRNDGSTATASFTDNNTNTTYSKMSLSEMNAGTATSSRTVDAKNLNDWGNGKFAPANHTHSYIPLSGGTATGALAGTSLGVNNSSNSTGKGLSLYNGATSGKPSYGMMFAGTATFGKHGSVQGDWATYFTMSGANNRGWIFQLVSTNVASISATGVFTGNSFVESSLRSLKTNIKPFEKAGLELINEIEIVTFDRKDNGVKDKIGIIADDSPGEFLNEEKNAVDLYKTMFVQAKAIQELSEVNKELEQKVSSLEARLEKLEKLLM